MLGLEVREGPEVPDVDPDEEAEPAFGAMVNDARHVDPFALQSAAVDYRSEPANAFLGRRD